MGLQSHQKTGDTLANMRCHLQTLVSLTWDNIGHDFVLVLRNTQEDSGKLSVRVM